MKTLHDFFVKTCPSLCSAVSSHEIHDLPQSDLLPAVVDSISDLLSLPLGVLFQLERFGKGRPLLELNSQNVSKLLTDIGCSNLIPKAAGLSITQFAVAQLTDDELKRCANALAITPAKVRFDFILRRLSTSSCSDAAPPIRTVYNSTVTVVDNQQSTVSTSSAKRRRRRKKQMLSRAANRPMESDSIGFRSVPESFTLKSKKTIRRRCDSPHPPPPVPPLRRFRNSEKWCGSPPKSAASTHWSTKGPTSVPFAELSELDTWITTLNLISTTDWEVTQNGRILRVKGNNFWKNLTIVHYNTGRVVFQGNPILARRAVRLFSHFLGDDSSDSSSIGDDDDAKLSAKLEPNPLPILQHQHQHQLRI